MSALLSFFASNTINAVGLAGLRHFASEPQSFLKVVFWGYAICGPGLILVYGKRETISWRLLAMLPWALALSLIYYLYLNFPNTVTFSQLVVVQSAMPFIAALFFRSSASREKYKWLKATPLLLLLLISATQWVPGGSPGVLVALAACYLTAQISGRAFAPADRRQTLLALNTGTFFVLGIWVASEAAPIFDVSWSLALAIVAFGLALYCVQYLFLNGLRSAAPILSALGVSSSVPIGIGIESMVKHAAPSLAVTSLSLAYVSVVFLIAWLGEHAPPAGRSPV